MTPDQGAVRLSIPIGYSARHYIGATYQYQMLLAYPVAFRAQTTTNGVMLFYSIYLKPTVSLSFFGGPQYSDTRSRSPHRFGPGRPRREASLSWQERQTNFAVSYSRMIAPGGGLDRGGASGSRARFRCAVT